MKFGSPPGLDWTPYAVPLDITAGWVDGANAPATEQQIQTVLESPSQATWLKSSPVERVLAAAGTRSSRHATSPSQTNQVMLAARTAAPSPIALKSTLTAMMTGTARRDGSHRPRHCGSRRNASASTGGTRK